MLRRILASQQAGLVLVIVLLGIVLSAFAGTHPDRATGQTVNDFLNSYTLIQTATDASFFAVMAVGATMVIISGGIDLSVGSIYALSGVAMGVLRGIAFVVNGAESILLPPALTGVAKASLGLAQSLYPVPILVMIGVTICGA